jgi:hypothetical protein
VRSESAEPDAAPRGTNSCTKPGCSKTVLAKGLCVAHYREKLRKQQN